MITYKSAGILARYIYTHFDRTEPHNNLIIRNVYNKRAEMRRRELNDRTPIQTLLQSLTTTGKFSSHYQIKFKDQNGPLTYLFITHQPHKLLFTLNSEIIIIDSTYKTNRFKIPIFNFVESTAINQNFLTESVFISNKIVNDHVRRRFSTINSFKINLSASPIYSLHLVR